MKEKVIVKQENANITLIWSALPALPVAILMDNINLKALDVILILPGEHALLIGTKPAIARKV